MRCVTWNIRLGLQQGLLPIIETLRRENADLIALQEVGKDWSRGPEGDTAAAIANALGFHHVFSPSIVAGHQFYGHALLSRWPITKANVYSLPEEVDEPRTLLQAFVDHPSKRLQVLSTHLSHVEDREIQVPHLLKFVREHQPDLVMGDLNAHEEPWLDRLADALPLAVQEALTFPTPEPTLRLDYLFGKGTWSDVATLDTGEMSDHYPVRGILTFS